MNNTLTTPTTKLPFGIPEYFGNGISVKQLQFPNERVPFKATYFTVAPGVTTPVDRHEAQELWVVLDGCGELQTHLQKQQIAKNDVLHFDSFQGHSVTNTGDDTLLICSIYW